MNAGLRPSSARSDSSQPGAKPCSSAFETRPQYASGASARCWALTSEAQPAMRRSTVDFSSAICCSRVFGAAPGEAGPGSGPFRSSDRPGPTPSFSLPCRVHAPGGGRCGDGVGTAVPFWPRPDFSAMGPRCGRGDWGCCGGGGAGVRRTRSTRSGGAFFAGGLLDAGRKSRSACSASAAPRARAIRLRSDGRIQTSSSTMRWCAAIRAAYYPVMVTDKKLGFIGAGNMGEALFKGLLNTKAARPEQIWVSARRPERVRELGQAYGVNGGANAGVGRASDVVVLAVKPQILDQVLRGISPDVSREKLIVSVAAGVPIAAIERRLHPPMRIVRALPNTPATVGAGATANSLREHATEADLATARTIFDSVGLTVVLEESQLDAVTGLSGSGPAYLFLIIEALAAPGVTGPLSRRASPQLAAQTVLGSAKLLIESGQHPGMLKDGVTSPGGTAIAGLHTLEAGGLRNRLVNAVEAATRRSRELGGGV